MAVAIWDVLRRPGASPRVPAALFAAQLVLNLAWSPVFFAWHLVGPALVIIAALWVCIAACIVTFWRLSRLGTGLMGLYLLWISIATSLNAWVWLFND